MQSPMVEFLKQASKDNVAPSFLPFKKIKDAKRMTMTFSSFPKAKGNEINFSLDSVSIGPRVAPSIAAGI